jgi:shikimate kinase
MKKVAVFGNAGGGKSTLARRVAEPTRLPLFTHYQWVTKRLVKALFVAPEASPAEMRIFLEAIKQERRNH